MPAGRPTAYLPEYAQQATKYCLLGATDAQLADLFDVSETTINNWKSEFPEFLESIRAGKRVADAEVAASLFNRARGAQYTTQQAFKVKRIKFNEAGKKIAEDEEVVTVPVEVVEAPDTTACSFWLKNRKAEGWSEKVTSEITGKNGGPIQASVTVQFVNGPNDSNHSTP